MLALLSMHDGLLACCLQPLLRQQQQRHQQ
jgi:hypothetical protein